jgi:hypothetical protein
MSLLDALSVLIELKEASEFASLELAVKALFNKS